MPTAEQYAAPRRTNNSKLARRRIELGMTQAQVADAIGVYPHVIARWETGAHDPNVRALLKLSRVLQCHAEDLIEERNKDE